MAHKLTRIQRNILLRNKAHGWEYEDDCDMCQYMKRMDFAEGGQSYEELESLYMEAKTAGIIAGDEIDLELLKADLEQLDHD